MITDSAILRELAQDVLTGLLDAYGLKCGGDYTVEVEETDRVLVFHVEIGDGENEDPRAAVLIGKGGLNIVYLQKVFFTAVAHRLNGQVPKGILLVINDFEPNMKVLANGRDRGRDQQPPNTQGTTTIIIQGGRVTTQRPNDRHYGGRH